MARKDRDRIREQDITGLKYFDRLAPLLERLRDVGCQRDRAGNRELHFDQYGLLVLLYLFNPIVTSLRGIQQASELAKVQKKLGCPRASLGALSEAATVFDAERLIYRFRWTIEIFFRFFKHVLGCRHLLSHRQNGIEIQTYCAEPRIPDWSHHDFCQILKKAVRNGVEACFYRCASSAGRLSFGPRAFLLDTFYQRNIAMKTLFAFALVVALSSVTAIAGDGRISQSSFARMGLSTLKPMTDQEGSTIRGRSVAVSIQPVQPVNPVQGRPLPRPPELGHFSVHR